MYIYCFWWRFLLLLLLLVSGSIVSDEEKEALEKKVSDRGIVGLGSKASSSRTGTNVGEGGMDASANEAHFILNGDLSETDLLS